MTKTKETIQPTTDEVREQARNLIRNSHYGALAVMDPQNGRPSVTRVSIASDDDNTPLLLVSGLSTHTPALNNNPVCSLLLGEPGKGDPLAHPRITLACQAVAVPRDNPDYPRLRTLYLEHNPKAKLYIDLGDFVIFRLEIDYAGLNGGFGKAYRLDKADIITELA